MRYEGMIYRPPSEAYSLIVQVTIGCSQNRCIFCSMFKEKRFRIRKVEEVLEDLQDARNKYRYVEKIFLADGDALICKMTDLESILHFIKDQFPECLHFAYYTSHYNKFSAFHVDKKHFDETTRRFGQIKRTWNIYDLYGIGIRK